MSAEQKKAPFFISKLALADLVYDKTVSLCIVASLMAVITPLLLLFSLKYGVISQLRHQLLDNPKNLEVRINLNQNLPLEWFYWLKQQPEVGFIIPLTRTLSVQADLKSEKNADFASDVQILPTDNGDPLVKTHLTLSNGVVLSSFCAEKLNVQIGDQIQLVVSRISKNRTNRQNGG